MRAELLERYRALPLPSTRDEHWRFTDLTGFDPDAWTAEAGSAGAVESLVELDVAAADPATAVQASGSKPDRSVKRQCSSRVDGRGSAR